jgi:hypothetical protein
MVWLHGETPYLGAKQEAGGQSESAAVAFRHRSSEVDGSSAPKTGAEDAKLSASPPPEPGVAVQMRVETALQHGSTKAGPERTSGNPVPSNWDSDGIANTAPPAVEPRRRLLRDDTKHAGILDRAGKRSSDKARRTGPTKVTLAEGVEKRKGDGIATAPALPVAAVGSDKLRGWLTADEPFVGPGGVDR